MSTRNRPSRPNGDPDTPSEVDVLRILDAEGNRAGEGLRVIEDHVRFVLDDRYLMSLTKAVRHDLTAALAIVAKGDRLAARETQADIGPSASASFAQNRHDPAD